MKQTTRKRKKAPLRALKPAVGPQLAPAHVKASGRPPKPPGERKERVTVSLLPRADAQWAELARQAQVSKGGIVQWLVLSPEAKEARRAAVKHAHFFVPPLDR